MRWPSDCRWRLAWETFWNGKPGRAPAHGACPQRGRQARELDEHREVDTSHDLDAVGFEKRHAEVRRRATEHVGEDEHAAFTADALDGLRNLLAGVVDLVVPANRNGCKSRQLADDHLDRVDELCGQLAVRDDDDADHRALSRSRCTTLADTPLRSDSSRFRASAT